MKPNSECFAWMKMTCRKILLLVWKNFLFRKRSYILTIFEIVLPTLLIILMAYLQTNNRKRDTSRSPLEPLKNRIEPLIIFERKSEQEMLSEIYCTKYETSKCTLAYAPNNNENIKEIMNKIIEKLSTRNKFKLMGFQNEKEIESHVTKMVRVRVNKKEDDDGEEKFYGAIVFEEGLQYSSNFPKNHKILYKIRLLVRDHQSVFKNTESLFPLSKTIGANEDNSKAYLWNGFSGLQIIIDKILTTFLTKTETNHMIYTQPFPYHAFIELTKEKTGRTLRPDETNLYLFPQYLVFGMVLIVPSIILNVVSEKKTGIKELMKMMGLPNWMHWVGWMLNSMIIQMITVTIIIILLFVPFSEEAGPIISSKSNWTLLWFVLCLYTMAGTAFCFFLSAIFQMPILATVVGIVLWTQTFFVAVMIDLFSLDTEPGMSEQFASALLPNSALHWLIRAIGVLDAKGEGARWDNLAEPVDKPYANMSVGPMILMLILDIIVYMFLAIYLENIIPSEYGVRKPWYYIFKPPTCLCRLCEYICKKRNAYVMPMSSDNVEVESPGFETEPSNLTPGVIIRNLRKSFGSTKVAVNNVSLKMFNGQITILLGHNGAGKTTIMSILTGLFAPTSGTAIINGYDINTQIDQVRDSLGLCPQHNLLFEKLTVEEHLIFFGRVKGLTFTQAKADMIVILVQLRLTEKRKVLSKALSGGQKRKLSLGIALIGGTKVLILDEPTSGMDPEARRAIWDILLEMRGLRTILLTTHFMEEADVLGDRIAIMADGRIKCCGSPIYLKRFFGAGYTLRMTLETNSDKDAILCIVQKRIPSASWKYQKILNLSEIAITLPSGVESTSLFPSMFADLTEKKEKIGICTLGLSLTTMDDVFIRVGELADEDEEVEHEIRKPIDSNRQNVLPIETDSPGIVADRRPIYPCKGGRLYLQQFWAVLIKRFLYTTRKPILLIVQYLSSLLLLILAIYLSMWIFNLHVTNDSTPESHHTASTPPSPQSHPPLKMNLSHYKGAVTMYSYTDKGLADNYASVVGSGASVITSCKDLTKCLLDVSRNNWENYYDHYIIAADLNTDIVDAMFSTIPFHSSSLAINLVSNAMLRKMAPDKSYSIVVTNHPFPDTVKNYQKEEVSEHRYTELGSHTVNTITIIFRSFMCLSLAIFSAGFVIFPIEEKLSQAKQLQLMTGISPLIFWISSFLWDLFMMIILILLMLICFLIFEEHEAFTTDNAMGVIFLILLIYGYATIHFSYVCSLFLKTVAGGSAFVTLIHIITGLILSFIIGSFGSEYRSNDDLYIVYIIFRLIGSIFPTFGAIICISRYIQVSLRKTSCNLNLGGPCIEPYLFWSMPKTRRSEVGKIEMYDIPGMGQDLLYLLLLGIFYHCLLVLIEYGFIQIIVDKIFESKSSTFPSPEDPHVQAEANRVNILIQTGHVNDEAFVVSDFCKSFGSFAAVSNLNFAVHHGECFGLLGVNGAGKTTTFRMLTGDEIRSSGNVFMHKYTLEKNRKEFLSKLGYCPQFDGIIGVLTGREMLELFCRLRGVPGKSVATEANKWLNKIGLYESGNVQCGKYSGGMKRRLSAGIALVGDPEIILLDEPTSGVDPVSRRRFWNVLQEVCESGQAVILTSHSMDECEALCSRLGIMVNGQFQCFGGVQHLKSKFVKGFSLLLKLSPLITSGSPELQSLQAEINEKFDPCTLKDQHLNILQYEVYKIPIQWAYVFQTMEDLKIRYVNMIEDFSVNETTLEEVFLYLAKNQYPPRVTKVSCLKKFCTCQCC